MIKSWRLHVKPCLVLLCMKQWRRHTDPCPTNNDILYRSDHLGCPCSTIHYTVSFIFIEAITRDYPCPTNLQKMFSYAVKRGDEGDVQCYCDSSIDTCSNVNRMALNYSRCSIPVVPAGSNAFSPARGRLHMLTRQAFFSYSLYMQQ